MLSPSLPRSWFLHSRTFWLGLLVTAFFAWLTIDSFFYLTAYRTIHRGSWKDWSGSNMIPAGTPDETGSFVAKIYGGCIFVSWHDRIPENADYHGTDERVRLTDDDDFYWTPKVFLGNEVTSRTIGFRLPTWCLLLLWLGIWARQLVKSRNRHLSHLTYSPTPAS
ncbi:MAG TPA: hypothetical protein VGE67_19290 [Haloferula sp.]